MRKALYIVAVLLLFAAMVAPNAHADSLYTVTLTVLSSSGTVPNPSFGLATFSSSDFLQFSVIPDTGEPTLGFGEGFASPTDIVYFCDGCTLLINSITHTASPSYSPPQYVDSFYDANTTAGGSSFIIPSLVPPADLGDTGYVYGTLSLAPVPEPSSVVLIMAATGLLLVVRKRLV